MVSSNLMMVFMINYICEDESGKRPCSLSWQMAQDSHFPSIICPLTLLMGVRVNEQANWSLTNLLAVPEAKQSEIVVTR